MATKTVTFYRQVTSLKTFASANLAGLEVQFNAYVQSQSLISQFTISVRLVSSYFDGTNYILVVETFFPEINDDANGQIPELT